MNREIIDRVFRRDFSKLLGFDLFEVTDDLEFVTFKDWFQELLIKPVTVPLITATRNLIHVVTQFMEYDPERFPNPLDQYVYIYENREEILKILASDLKVDNPFDCPIAYTLWYRLNARFERLIRHILTVGRTHKFDADYIVDHLLVGSDEPETD